MLYAIISIMFVLLIFLVVTYFVSSKNYSFEIENHKIRVQNRGAHLKIFIDDKLIDDHYMPQLIRGEEYKLQIDSKEVILKIRSSSFGYKMSVEIIIDDQVVADNGVKIKNKKDKTNDVNEENKDDDLESKVFIDSNKEN